MVNQMDAYDPNEPAKEGDLVEVEGKDGLHMVQRVIDHVYGEGEGMDPSSSIDAVVVNIDGKDVTVPVDEIKKITRKPSIARSAGRKRKTRRGKSKKTIKRHHRKTRVRRH
jgi:uncharacterized protein (DUF2384 family)